MACMTRRKYGNPGDPVLFFQGGETFRSTERRESGTIEGRESDHLIVLEKVGNATGGKEVTYSHAKWGHTVRTQRRKLSVNNTALHSRDISTVVEILTR